MKTYIVLDESGAMHLKNERYFIIGGFVTQELHKVTSAHKRVEAVVKRIKNIPLNNRVELKSSKISFSQQLMFINELLSIKGVIPIVIIVDKDNLTRFTASENMAYNFFVKNMLNYLFKCPIKLLKNKDIELRVDNRSTSVKARKDLETFLTWEFEKKKLDLKVHYLNSKYNRDIQMADYIANMFWKKYNSPKIEITSRIKKIKKIYISKFPYKDFGKNPSLREKTIVNYNNNDIILKEDL